MKLDARIKGGLAWAGLVVVLAVPSADLLFGKSETRAMITSDTSAVKPVAGIPVLKVDPVNTASISRPAADPVASYEDSGKTLPSYISDAPAAKAPVTLKPVAPASTASTSVAPASPTTQVASLPPAAVEMPPVPLSRDMRPKAPAVATVAPPAQTTAPKLSIPKSAVVAEPKPLIVDERTVERNAAIGRQVEDTIITEDKLEEWDSGSLADYLARKGLLSGSGEEPQVSDRYSGDEDVYYNDRPRQRTQNGTDTGFFLF